MLSLGTLSYLTYEGVRFFEELELACRERTVDLKPHLRRMHLVTTAIHEFILTLCTYLDFTHFSQADADKLRKLQAAVSSSLPKALCCNFSPIIFFQVVFKIHDFFTKRSKLDTSP